MKYFALTYDAVEGFMERRVPLRDSHLALVRAAHARGELQMAGALADPDGALFIFRVDNADTVAQFVLADPYVIQGLVKSWAVRPWTVMVGQDSH